LAVFPLLLKLLLQFLQLVAAQVLEIQGLSSWLYLANRSYNLPALFITSKIYP
jgi:hypothetical protein